MIDDTSSALPLVCTAVAALIGLNIVFGIAKGGFKRDAVKHSFTNPFVALSSLLSNKDSVLEHGKVKDSIEGYENLFDGKCWLFM